MKEKSDNLKSNLHKLDQRGIQAEDYQDIPELPDTFFAEGQLYKAGKPVKRGRGKQKKPTKIQTTIRLSPEVISYFKNQKGRGWQTEVNNILKKHVQRAEA